MATEGAPERFGRVGQQPFGLIILAPSKKQARQVALHLCRMGMIGPKGTLLDGQSTAVQGLSFVVIVLGAMTREPVETVCDIWVIGPEHEFSVPEFGESEFFVCISALQSLL